MIPGPKFRAVNLLHFVLFFARGLTFLLDVESTPMITLHQMIKKDANYLMLLSHKRLFQAPCKLLSKKVSAGIVNQASSKVGTNPVSQNLHLFLRNLLKMNVCII